jgi:hypothetical protein
MNGMVNALIIITNHILLERAVISMRDDNLVHNTMSQEKEIIAILLDSSLFWEMSPLDQRKLLHFLISSYY